MSDPHSGTEGPDPQVVTEAPPQLACYPRQGNFSVESPPGTPEQLLALNKGFGWLLLAFFLSIVVMFGVWGLPGDMRNLSINPLYGGIAVAAVSLFGCWYAGFGLGWKDYESVLCAILVGAAAPFCLGLFLLAFLLNAVVGRVFQYGVRRNAVGTFSRADLRETARRMKYQTSKI